MSTICYFDGSVAAATDPNAVWTNDNSAFDGSLSTFASTTSTGGSTSTNYLYAKGTNAPTQGGDISKVYARFYASISVDALDTMNAVIYTAALAENLGTVTRTGVLGAGWTAQILLTAPAAGWTWTVIKNLETKIYYFDDFGNNANGAYRVEIEVFQNTGSGQNNVTFEVGNGMSRSEMAN